MKIETPSITKKTWDEFKNTRLLWWVNRTLHLFGWCIILEMDKGIVSSVYPARVTFRGFNAETEEKGYLELSEYLKNNINDIHGDIVNTGEEK